MPLIQIIPRASTDLCSITSNGTVSLPQGVFAKTSWSYGDKINASYIEEPLTLVLSKTVRESEGIFPNVSFQIRKWSRGRKTSMLKLCEYGFTLKGCFAN